MHTDLAAHLHTPACNKLIEELQACHENVSVSSLLFDLKMC